MLAAIIYAALGLVAIVGIVLALASRRPDRMKIVRSVDIAAPAHDIFPLIDDLRLFSTWSPFEKDPAMKREYSGPDRGPGQRMTWNGNSNVGEGSVTILSSSAPTQVDMQLLMIRPMRGDNHVTFTLAPHKGGTTVTWAIDGASPLIAKVMSLFVDMDRMCGAAFEEGLLTLKGQVERSSVSHVRA